MKIGNSKVAIDAIEKYENIIIFHHIRPDGDCLGSQAGLAELIKTNYPNKKVYKVGSNEGIFPFMSWDFQNENEINFENSLAIVVDASSGDRIQNSEILYNNLTTAKLRIDHHPNESDINYDYIYVDEKFVAAAEMVAQIAFDAKWNITKEASEFIYLGINTDSARFSLPDTSSRTYKLVAFLMENGFHPQQILRNLNKRNLHDIKVSGHILSNFKKEGRVLYFYANKEFLKQFNLNSFEASQFVNVLGNIEDNNCWVLFIDLENGGIRTRIRSNGPSMIPVAKYFGGGGHDDRGGFNINEPSEIQNVISKLNLSIKEWEDSKWK
ncbi:phosphoesterase [Mycoplasmopsis canis]|uniref:DHH family phosphoesterase n=1 Tax=Mycoplasmopsis canis TaxID=29555 RepID=UPI000624E414|nr:bifunctional oligoribonuclease/PAP phosphatase NrnA [Mycoplasmopsis canis]AKF41117.1 phosphoesterase [Mycoplasmopsis canis]